MKKTLITLAALAASVASAASYENPSDKIQDGAFSAKNGEFTMIAVLDWTAAMGSLITDTASAEATLFSVAANHSSYGEIWVNGITVFNGWSGTTLEVGIQTDGVSRHGITADDDNGDSNHLSLKNTTHGTSSKLALAYTFKDGTISVSALQDDLETWDTLSYASGWSPYQAFDTINMGVEGVVTNLVTYNTALTGDALTAAATKVIPEPATATLSLLALAGLAARRRRK